MPLTWKEIPPDDPIFSKVFIGFGKAVGGSTESSSEEKNPVSPHDQGQQDQQAPPQEQNF